MALIRSAATVLLTIAVLAVPGEAAAAGPNLAGKPSWAKRSRHHGAVSQESAGGASSGELPQTGIDVTLEVAVAGLLLAAGTTLRLSRPTRQ